MTRHRNMRRALVSALMAGGMLCAALPVQAAVGTTSTPVPSTPSATSAPTTSAPVATPVPSAPVTSGPAVAPSTSAPAQTTPGTLTEMGAADMEALAKRYGSLSGALVNYYAVSQGQTLDEFVKDNPVSVAGMLGTNDTASLLNGSVSTKDLNSMNASLSAQGSLISSKDYDSLEGYAAALNQKSGNIDAAVVGAGANWATQMASLRTPALSTPAMPGVNTALATQMPKEGLVFGMFLDKSLTAMVTDFPDVYGQAQSTGLGTPAARQAWNTSMMNAMQASKADFSTMLPSQCGSTLLTVMGSGDAKAGQGAGCGSCVTAGLYLNSQMQRLFDPSVGSTITNPTDGVMPPNEFNSLQPWQRNLVSSQNPGLSEQLSQSVSGGSKTSSCGASGSATAGAVKTVLPGVLDNLNR